MLRWAAVAVVAAGLAWFLHEMRWQDLSAALRSATLWPLALVALLSFVNLFCKAACWRIMLAPRHGRVGLLRLFRYTVAAFATSAVTPARAGEFLRVWMLKSRDKVPAAESVAVAAAEKLLDGLSMLILVAPLPWLLPELPTWVSRSIAGMTAIAVALLAAAWIASTRVRSKGFFPRFVAGLEMLRRPGIFAGSLLVLVASWVADLAEVWLVLWALGIDLPPAAGLLVLLTLNMAIAVPSTPAQVGTLELGAVAGLTLLKVPDEKALAFALLYHGMQILPLILVGLLDIRFVLQIRREAATQPEGAAPPPV
ncbi:MAG: flippase-like domain-containing protein [Deltaproteobacteria bacterium]|nr:flippase-like domain-containing protein [Deltaproteobacteria bacterium]